MLLDDSDLSNIELKVLKDQPIDEIFYVKALTESGVSSLQQQIAIKVCGFESLVSTAVPMTLVYTFNDRL